MKKAMIYNLKESIKIQKHQVVSQVLYDDKNFELSIYSFDENEGLSYEKTAADRIYLSLEGDLIVKFKDENGEKSIQISPLNLLFLQKDIDREICSDSGYKVAMITFKGENMLKNIEGKKLLKLEEEIEYQADKVVSKTLASTEELKMTLFAFDGKRELSTHSAPGDALVIALDGSAKINIEGEDFILNKGDSIMMPAHAPHGVYVDGKYKMLLIVSK